ncbi:MAG: hypothetical protein ACI9MB_003236 [Verrucomicrobiales bacterium]|jgi:hypothetical protein
MVFLLYAAVGYLVWVYSSQIGEEGQKAFGIWQKALGIGHWASCSESQSSLLRRGSTDDGEHLTGKRECVPQLFDSPRLR